MSKCDHYMRMYGGNPYRDLLNVYNKEVEKNVFGWWSDPKDKEPEFANDLYLVIKMAEDSTLLTSKQREHIERCWDLLRVLNDLEGR